MPHLLKSLVQNVLKLAVILTPWLLSMYVFYWLDSSGTWTSETAHRGKLSVVLLATGMVLSFLLQSYFAGRKRQTS